MKLKKIESSTFFKLAILVASVLGFTALVLCKLLLDKADYVSFIEQNLTVIYFAAFFIAIFELVVKPRR